MIRDKYNLSRTGVVSQALAQGTGHPKGRVEHMNFIRKYKLEKQGAQLSSREKGA